MERLPGRREYLGTFFGGHAPLEDGQHLPQGSPGEADSDISTSGLRSAHGQADNPALHQTKARTTNRMCYKAHQDALDTPSKATRKRRQRRGDKKEATRKRQQGRGDKEESESVQF